MSAPSSAPSYCPHCGAVLLYNEVERARQRIYDALCYLRGRDDEFHLMEISIPWESGALHALDWVLARPGAEWFDRHLESLRKIDWPGHGGMG